MNLNARQADLAELYSAPVPRAVPWLWRWDTVLALAAEAGREVPVGRGGERRALARAPARSPARSGSCCRGGASGPR
jgi:gentisate 1,2-dioxygenase